jgi:NAD(P)H-dependent flavin oxidoreductase YrpB (nitropropane dioxygenase family)
MSGAPFPTAITELFGTRLPIVAGGLMWLANADYVAAASRAGIIGFITAASFPDPAALRAEIRRCRSLCDGGPFGVNVSMLPKLLPGEKTRAVFEAENPAVTIQDLMPLVAGKIGRNAYVTGDWSKGLLAAGHSLAFVDRIEPLAAIVARFETDMQRALARLPRMSASSISR